MDKERDERLEVVLADITDGATIRARITHNGDEGKIALIGQGDFAAGKHADTVGLDQQAGHHDRRGGRRASGLPLIRGIEAAEIELGHSIEEKKDPVACRQLGRRELLESDPFSVLLARRSGTDMRRKPVRLA